MNGFNTTANGSQKVFRIALFGPQVTAWTADSLSRLQLDISKDANLQFLKHTLESISSIWPLLQKEFSQHGCSGAKKLEALEAFSTGAKTLDPDSLTNTELAPLTIVSQIVDFIHQVKSSEGQVSLSSFEAAQGFCIGFLSAAALTSAKDWSEFKSNVSNAIRLAACAGVVVDVQESSLDTQDKAVTLSARWKTAADRELLEDILDRCPRVSNACRVPYLNFI